MLDISFIPAFKDNYIWLLRQGQRAMVVDPGDASPVSAYLEAEGLQLEAILITHHHADHQGGVAALAGTGNVCVYAPENESITGCTVPLSGGERFEWQGIPIEVLPVPGHTAGHLAYRMPGCVFCGDVLFGAGCGRVFEGTMDEMFASLNMLAALPDETLIYCAHEYTAANVQFALTVEPDNQELQKRSRLVSALRSAGKTTVPLRLVEEKKTNPFLRCGHAAVRQAVQLHEPDVQTPAEVFCALRRWKNRF